MARNSGGRPDPYRILISCILSLRTQDKTTAEASERLFTLAPDITTAAGLSVRSIEKAIYPVGFYKVKAHTVRDLSRTIIANYRGIVPDTIEELTKLRGIGRKTANLVVTLGYQKPGICVDTHVHRITNRWGYVCTKTPDQTEQALRAILPRRYWIGINGLLVTYGQNICKPVSPLCSTCSVSDYCKKTDVTRSR